MQFIDAEMVKEEMAEAVRASDMLTKMVMDECKTVGRGLLATVYRMVLEAEGEGRVLQ